MRYRGGGIGHGYMRVIEGQFKDMSREQDSPEDLPRVLHPSLHDSVGSAGDPPVNLPSIIAPDGDTSMADSDDNSFVEDENAEDERPGVSHEDDYLAVNDDDDNDDGEGIGQGTYGLGEY